MPPKVSSLALPTRATPPRVARHTRVCCAEGRAHSADKHGAHDWVVAARQTERADRQTDAVENCTMIRTHSMSIASTKPVHKSSHLESRYGPHAHSGQLIEHNVHIALGLAHSIALHRAFAIHFIFSLPLVHTFTHTHTCCNVSHEAKRNYSTLQTYPLSSSFAMLPLAEKSVVR
jgi:hypothetical protein